MSRITEFRCQKLLDHNEGFSKLTNFISRKLKEKRHYKIFGGQLHIFADGKKSQTGEPYLKAWIASGDEALRFFRQNRNDLDTVEIE